VGLQRPDHEGDVLVEILAERRGCPSTCLRSDSDSVHSQNRLQASSRLGALISDEVSLHPVLRRSLAIGVAARALAVTPGDRGRQ
jgi:hypothetical protein